MSRTASRLARRLVRDERVARLGRRVLDALEVDDLDALMLADPPFPLGGGNAARIREALRSERASSRVTLLAPLSGRVFDEVLVAIPFLRRGVRSHAVDPTRLLARSGPQARSWYTTVAGPVLESPPAAAPREEPAWLEPLRALAAETNEGSVPPLALLRLLEHERFQVPAGDTWRPCQPERSAPALVSIEFPATFPPTPANRDLLERVALRVEAAGAVRVSLPQTPVPAGSAVGREPAQRQAELDARVAALDHAVPCAGIVVAPLCSDAIALALSYGVPALGLAPSETTPPATIDFMLRVARRLRASLSVVEPSELELVASLLPPSETP